MANPTKYIQSQGGVEALFQGAAKGAKEVLERGERLGINQAVRDAVGEIKRNVSNFNESRQISQSSRGGLDQGSAGRAFTALERRNKHLASMLDETVDSLKTISSSTLDDKARSLELIELAAARIQFVKVYLEDVSMELPTHEPAPDESHQQGTAHSDQADLTSKPGGETARLTAPNVEEPNISTLDLSATATTALTTNSTPNGIPTTEPSEEPEVKTLEPKIVKPASTTKLRPSAPIPTRSTLAQSSFSWMLEPDESSPKMSPKPSPAKITKSPPAQHKKKASNNASRERNAFLFGEVTAEQEGRSSSRDPEEIFGLEPLGKTKSP